MGMLIDGEWVQQSEIATIKNDHFERPQTTYRNWITMDGTSGFKAEPERYHLYISYACPWACRTLIFLTLKNLSKVVTWSYVDAFMGEMGWTFGQSGDETKDPINNVDYMFEIYQQATPDYSGRVTVPVLWDKNEQTIVNNESAEIIRMLNSEFNKFTTNQYDYYPKDMSKEIDAINDLVYENINNGVYKCGFAKSQQSYDEAVEKLFSALNKVEKILDSQRYLVGNQITEADWRLFTTLIRFDQVYVFHFKCNRRMIKDYYNLWNYLLELYQYPGIKETVHFDHIKQHYFQSHKTINPTGIIPDGPLIDYNMRHDRERFG